MTAAEPAPAIEWGPAGATAPPLDLDALEAEARERLPPMAYDFFAGGAHDEITLRENRRAFHRLALRPRVLRGVGSRDLSTTLLGGRRPHPICISPMAFHGMAHKDGELATARAAAATGTTLAVSLFSNAAIEEVRAASDAPLWSHVYVFRDRGVTRELVERVEGAGVEALVVTVDAPLYGHRPRDVRNGFRLPAHLDVGTLRAAAGGRLDPAATGAELDEFFLSQVDPALTWRDVDWLRSLTSLPLLLKGILRGDDAAIAVEHGAAGVIVSNHGGRQLDTAVPSVTALPEVVDAVAGRADVLLDSGVRRGTDVLKALALGARAVMVGRPVIWGLAAGGEAGVAQVLLGLRAELDLAMALSGASSTAAVSPDLLALPS
ncbi:MAG TPA: alpha-hydroxy acid oxidase [Gemmatimonadales bacterium]|nr:alpha-hydroxy acid oxidase [Gemmatimonadales bacterium]